MTTSSSARTAGTTIHLSHRMFAGIVALVATPWVVVTCLALRGSSLPEPLQPAAAAASSSALASSSNASASIIANGASTTRPSIAGLPQVSQSKTGAWGQMEIVPIVLDVPDEYLNVQQTLDRFEKWTFTGKSREQALELMKTCGFTSAQLAMAEALPWNTAYNTSTVTPSDELVRSLSKETRGAFYNVMVTDSGNASSVDPYWFREGKIDARFRGIPLSADAMNIFQSLLYKSPDGALLFNDVSVALRAVADPTDRKLLYRAASRNRAVMARLYVTADSNVNALAEYWGEGGRQKDLLPVLNSIKYNAQVGIESPGKINLVTVLPRFARERLYNRASITQGTQHLEDCFWSAFNFFNDVPDNRINDMDYLASLLERDYYKISEPTRLGDVILLGDAKGDVQHAANYIGDNIVFTKNGGSVMQPWILCEMEDMLQTYRLKSPTMTVAYFRKK